MTAAPTTAVDLPLKVVAWQDDQGVTYLGFNEPGWIAERHGVYPETSNIVGLTANLTEVVRQAISPR